MTGLTGFGIRCNEWYHCNKYQMPHMQLNKPYKNLLLKKKKILIKINPIKSIA
jgi:hypothetical protein